MTTDNGRPEAAAASPQQAPSAAPSDPLREVWELKRRVQLGVYGAILGLLPFYIFLVRLSPVELSIVYSISLLIAFTAIEGAFAQMLRLRKRSSYPGTLVIELGGIQSSQAAAETSMNALSRLLRLEGSFLCLGHPGSLGLVAFIGLDRVHIDRLLRLGAADIREAMEAQQTVPFRPAVDLVAEAVLTPSQRLVFVPVRSLQQCLGVLGLLGSRSNQDLCDEQLLMGLGLALGLTLENLRQTEELRLQSATDEVTKVYNRRYFFDQLEREMAVATRYSLPLAVIIVDLDGFKQINDTLGHVVGDKVLNAVAQRLVRYSRAADLVARMGGDEFALLLPRTETRGAAEVADRLRRCVAFRPVQVDGQHHVTVSICCGVASYPEDAQDIEGLIRHADAQLYCGKASRGRALRSHLSPPAKP